MFRRKFAIAPDATAGGSSYDDIVTLASADPGGIPNPTEDWPVTGGTFDKGLDRRERAGEVHGPRAAPPPEPWRAAPGLTTPVPPYLRTLARAIQLAFGGAPVRTGVAPAAFTDKVRPLGYGAGLLPARHVDLVRDDLHVKASGAVINQLSCDFPADGDSSIEAQWMALYYKTLTAADAQTMVAAVFTGLNQYTLKARDAKVFIDGAGVAVPDFQGFSFAFDNQLTRKWHMGKNRVPEAAGSCRIIHFPEEHRLHQAQAVTHTMRLGNTNEAEELKQDFSKVEKVVYEVEGCPMGTTPAATELFRITFPGSVITGGGAEGLSKSDDITSSFEMGAFHSDTDGYDVEAEFVYNSAGLFT